MSGGSQLRVMTIIPLQGHHPLISWGQKLLYPHLTVALRMYLLSSQSNAWMPARVVQLCGGGGVQAMAFGVPGKEANSLSCEAGSGLSWGSPTVPQECPHL